MGEGYSPGRFGQPCQLGQRRLPQKPWQDHSRHLPNRTQSVQGHATG